MTPPPDGTPAWMWLVAVLAVTGIVAVTNFLSSRSQRADLREVKEQVANTHDTNLRHDVDKLINGVSELIGQGRQTSKDIGGLREELRTERLERIEQSKRLHRVEIVTQQLDRRAHQP